MLRRTARAADRFGVAALFLALALCCAPAFALQADQIALLVNKNVPQGRKLAEFYAAQRHIPDQRIIELDLPAPDPNNFPEEMTPQLYDAKVAPVVRAFLTGHGLQEKVTCLVTFWGMPLRTGRRAVSDLDKAERSALEAQLNDEVTANVEREVKSLENLATSLNPSFKPAEGASLAQLSGRAATAMNAAFAKIIGTANTQRRQEAFAQFISASEALVGSDLTTTRLIDPQIVRFIPNPPTTQQAQSARERVDASHREIARLSNDLHDPKIREMARALARKDFGLLGYAEQLRHQASLLDAEQSEAALDSELSLLWWPDYPKARWVNNPLRWNSAANTGLHTLMVCRLDAPTSQIVHDLIATSIKVEQEGLHGQAALDALGRPPTHPYAAYDATIRKLAERLTGDGKIPVTFDNQEPVFPAHSLKDIAIYCGWYSLRNYIPPGQFNAGAVGFHVASFELVSLHAVDEKGWVHGLLRDGIVATVGPVAEPFLQSFPPADEFFPLLLTGKLTLAEVYWRTCPWVSWMQTCIGDPLYRPYLHNPPVDSASLPPELARPIN